MIILALDCSAALCAASVYDAVSDRELGREVRDLGKGHAEHLMQVIETALERAGIGYDGVQRIAVSIGPGSFTGIRVAVSTARGLALALKVPAVGVSTLEAIASEAREIAADRPVLVVLNGGRGEVHGALYDASGEVSVAPQVMTLDDTVALVRDSRPVLAGNAAQAVAEASSMPVEFGPFGATADIAVYARLGADKPSSEKPSPLYLRAPDAKPQASFVLPRKADE
ncbi:tRNA (adenosine(37)-N6)-threonylcarbamoyltransferase complex dimerization subunit type 1 TsaB [Corticibacterium sp. UT-5YL-CI-8]|nr:tRNA (adenosine(37)-N6)-threonylcarbamoyltransferase complex dimerization subunit type 1 TsaB [Tianweitania sp. UT-5YL-CI-8]